MRLSVKRSGLVLFLRGISRTWEVLHDSMKMRLRGPARRLRGCAIAVAV